MLLLEMLHGHKPSNLRFCYSFSLQQIDEFEADVSDLKNNAMLKTFSMPIQILVKSLLSLDPDHRPSLNSILKQAPLDLYVYKIENSTTIVNQLLSAYKQRLECGWAHTSEIDQFSKDYQQMFLKQPKILADNYFKRIKTVSETNTLNYSSE